MGFMLLLKVNLNKMKEDLKKIVPEYNSKIPFVKNIFFKKLNLVANTIEIKDNFNILEIGCGEGILLNKLKEKNPNCNLVGIDINPNVNFLSIPNTIIKIEDATNMSFKDNSFDLVYAVDVLEHIKDVDLAIKEIKRVLKEKGKLIISGPTETTFYRLCRLLIKQKWILKEHYYNVNDLNKKIIDHNFYVYKKINIPKYPFDLEKIIVYTKS